MRLGFEVVKIVWTVVVWVLGAYITGYIKKNTGCLKPN